MKALKLFATVASCTLLLVACDANRELRNTVQQLASESQENRASCDEARKLENNASDRRWSIRTELSGLRADKEWDAIVQTGDAGTSELLIQSKRAMDNPAYKSERDHDIERLEREIKLYEADEPELQRKRQIACDAMLKSGEAYRSAKKALEEAEAKSQN
jgi:hypothetical protein